MRLSRNLAGNILAQVGEKCIKFFVKHIKNFLHINFFENLHHNQKLYAISRRA